MKKILNTTAIAGSLCLLGTSVFAQTKGFEGGHFGIAASIAGVTAESSKRSDITTTNSGNAGVGAVVPLGNIDVGYTVSAGKDLAVTLGATYLPLKGEVSGKSNDSSSGKAYKFEVKDIWSVYLQPHFVINPNASFFIKLGYTQGDANASNITTPPGDLKGYLGSAGLRVNLTGNAFVQVEGVYTKYDTLTAKDVSTFPTETRTISAEPEIAEGRITVGFKF